MSTKIFYNDNRIIIDGHADTPTECQAITAMCDSMANSENFKTIVYERGHAVFERVNGGDALMFEECNCDLSLYLSRNEASMLYETKEAHELSIAMLQSAIDQINSKIGYPDIENYGTIGDQLYNLNSTITEVMQLAEKAIELAVEAKEAAADKATSAELTALDTRVIALEESAGDSEAITALETRVTALEDSTADSEAITALETRVDFVESMVSTIGNKTEVALPYTADELIAKLESI